MVQISYSLPMGDFSLLAKKAEVPSIINTIIKFAFDGVRISHLTVKSL